VARGEPDCHNCARCGAQSGIRSRAERVGRLVQNNNAILVDAYLAKRGDLIRFFTQRLRSPAAAEDLVQEIYLKLAAVDPSVQFDNPGAFLFRLGSNLMLDKIRGERRSAVRDADYRQGHHAVVGGEDVADLAPADEAVAAKLRLERLVEILKGLPPLTQTVFSRHKFDGLSHSEVAAELRISRSAVEKHVSAALKYLLARPT
jgi:RNA polymerase sigma factor (sigma-70 family)